MPQVELIRGRHTRVEGTKGNRRRVRYHAGDSFNATKREMQAFGDKLRRVTGSRPVPAAKPPSQPATDPSGMGVRDSMPLIRNTEDIDTLLAWRDKEAQGPNRATIIDAIDAQIGRFESAGANDPGDPGDPGTADDDPGNEQNPGGEANAGGDD